MIDLTVRISYIFISISVPTSRGLEMCQSEVNSPLSFRPSQQNLLRLDSQPLGNLVHGLINGSTRLGGDRDEGGVSLGYDVLPRHEFQEGYSLFDDIGVEENLVDDGFHRAGGEEFLEVWDGVAASGRSEPKPGEGKEKGNARHRGGGLDAGNWG